LFENSAPSSWFLSARGRGLHRHRRSAALLACSALLAGCGGSAHKAAQAPSRAAHPVDRSGVIKDWADALRMSHVDAATAYFAVPVIVENGTPPVRLTQRSEVRQFNAALPCGARLLRTVTSGRYTIATFRLTNRPGSDCAGGVGQKAATAFAFRGGKIAEWRRVPLPATPRAAPPAPRPGTRSS
jgi:hypothetical protein